MMKILSAHSPLWSSADQRNIDLMVTFEGLGELPFTASATDSTAYGRELHARALAGEFGEIAPYQSPQ